MDNGPKAGGIPERIEAQGMLQLARWGTIPPRGKPLSRWAFFLDGGAGMGWPWSKLIAIMW
ncbi:hypothetical protein CGZ75_20290 [Paenibacillus herberti]|uniref:Uncharacterized protein n=1 Tax=Paenibacillus herberti TaxID=1619309 RepID=A0A229NU66_9BACL|nr:hypothetical protein CGZ75_20290 [Paenibacillus herberti]